MTADAIVRVRFLTSAEGGRQMPVFGPSYSSPMNVDGKFFDCRLLIFEGPLELGETYEVPVKFLSSQEVVPRLFAGKELTLWEGRTVAQAWVVAAGVSPVPGMPEQL